MRASIVYPLLLPLLVLPSPTAVARQDVVITGRVSAADSLGVAAGPLDAVAITVDGTTRGALTRPTGEYVLTLPNVTAGQRLTVRARRIGYAEASREVAVRGDTVRADFVMVTTVLQLQKVVVAGAADPAAGATRPFAAARVDGSGGTIQLRTGRGGGGGGGRGGQGQPGNFAGVRPEGAVAGAPLSAEERRELERRRSIDPGFNTEQYDRIYENPFIGVRTEPLSTFSIDVDRASYGNVRRFISMGQLPPKDAVRIEELVNYFTYAYPEPRGDHPVSITADAAPAPWKPAHRLVRIGLKGKSIDRTELPPSNLVFLIDVSGSMMPANKLPLVKAAFRLLVNELREEDHVSIVVYAGAAGLVLPPTSGADKSRILRAIDNLEAGGSTAGGAGIRLAYEVARAHHRRGGNNRVVLATDGDFNVGVSSDADMVRLVEEKREQGTFLTVLGFGMGNLKDSRLEKLADKGNGNYAYVDDLAEAKKVFVTEFGGTMYTIAKDVKLQIEFNPTTVAAYRLIGYENRLLRSEDFNDDTKDAGEIGSGHTVTALYEVIPVGAETDTPVRGVDPLRYQREPDEERRSRGDELLYVKLRYKDPDGTTSKLLDRAVADRGGRPSADFTFAAAVAQFGLVLRDSEYKGTASLGDVLALARRSLGEDEHGYRADFVRLVEDTRQLSRSDGRPGGDGR
jgi:Ca-activated chloride channel family protein